MASTAHGVILLPPLVLRRNCSPPIGVRGLGAGAGAGAGGGRAAGGEVTAGQVVVEVDSEVRVPELPDPGTPMAGDFRREGGGGGIDMRWAVVCGRRSAAPPPGWWVPAVGPGLGRGRGVREIKGGWGCADGGW
jgi:hypothetical protein